MKHTSRFLALPLALLTVLTVLAVFGMTSCGETNVNTDKTTIDTVPTDEPKKETSAKEESDKKGDQFSNFTGVDWINALEVGFVGDGKTPNDKAFASYAKYNSDRYLYFPNGVYCFEETLNFPVDVYVKMDSKAELKCIAEEPLDYFITLRGQFIDVENAWCAYKDYAAGMFDGGVINCNNKAKCAIGTFQGMGVTFQNMIIYDALEKGIQTLISKTYDGCGNYNNIRIYNTESRPGSIGVYDNGSDNHFNGISVCNYETAFYTQDGRYTDCSAWLLDMSVVENSTFAKITSNQSVWHNPSVDTYRYGFRFADNSSTSITDMIWIVNGNFYKEDLQKQYPRTMFYCESAGEAVRTTVTGLQFKNQKYLDFSNVEMPNAVFMNVRVPSGFNTADMKNFRNDTALMLNVANQIGARETGKLTGASNFDELLGNGVYECELRVGKNGVGLPPVKEQGVLEVEVIGKMTVQKFISSTTLVQRVYDGTKWGAWLS